jgi:hypothetical protein
VLGLLTLVLGCGYVVMGSILLGAAADMANDPAGGWAPLLQVFAGLIAVLGIPFLLQGVLGLLAGLGVLLRKSWGRLLTFLLAILAILWGLAFLGTAGQDGSSIALGATQLLYGIFAIILLFAKRR